MDRERRLMIIRNWALACLNDSEKYVQRLGLPEHQIKRLMMACMVGMLLDGPLAPKGAVDDEDSRLAYLAYVFGIQRELIRSIYQVYLEVVRDNPLLVNLVAAQQLPEIISNHDR